MLDFFSVSCLLILCQNEPYDGPIIINTPLTFEETDKNLSSVQEDFGNGDVSNYSELCENYNVTLEDYISLVQKVTLIIKELTILAYRLIIK